MAIPMPQLTFRALGLQILAILDTDDPRADTWLTNVVKQFIAWEAAVSPIHLDSELYRLNKQAGRSVRVSDTLWAILQAAQQAVLRSDGLVSPLACLPMRAVGAKPTYSLALHARGEIFYGLPSQGVDYRPLRLDPTNQSIYLAEDTQLDLSDIAKAWAAEEAVRLLASYGPALIDAEGSIAASGPRADGSPWPIGVIDPLHRGRHLDLLLMEAGGLSTVSRDYPRPAAQASDPDQSDTGTAWLARTDVLTATVLAPTLLEAQTTAQVALMLGGQAGIDWIENQPACVGLLALEGGIVRRSTGWSAHCLARS